jgi:hypothetical protein
VTFKAPIKHWAVTYEPGVTKAPEWAADVSELDRVAPDARIAMLEAQVHFLSAQVHSLIWRGV